MDTKTIVERIIEEQSLIVGKPLAENRAIDSGVVRISEETKDIEVIENNPEVALKKLVASYKILFGPASVAVCMKIIREYYSKEKAESLFVA